jgi:RND family efflux transporter MFP subunit
LENSRVVSGILMVAALALLSACGAKPPAAAVVTPVRVEAAQVLSSATNLKYSAQVVPETQVDVAFRTDGYVERIKRVPGVDSKQRLLQPGDPVQVGDVLARVKDEQYQDQVKKAQANLEKALAAARKGDQDFRRAQALNATESITGPDFDAAEKEYTTANAAVAGARAQLDEANIKLTETALVSPLGGIVQQRNIEVGTLVHSGSVGFVVANTGVVKVVFGVPDTVLGKIKLGSDLAIHTDSLPDRKFHGKVTEIAPAADQRTRIFEVSVSIENADEALRPGMVAALDIGDALRVAGNVVLVPITAMVQAPDGSFALYVVETTAEGADVARLRSVETGQILGNRITVTGGVTAGTRVIVSGTAQAGDNQPVKVVP